MKKLSLITRIVLCLVLGIGVGLLCGANNIQFPVKILATFSGLFGSFLSFIIPLIIIGFIVPGIASLGSKSGKGLIITTIIAYISTLVAGFAAYLVGIGILPNLIKSEVSLSEAGKSIEPYFNITSRNADTPSGVGSGLFGRRDFMFNYRVPRTAIRTLTLPGRVLIAAFSAHKNCFRFFSHSSSLSLPQACPAQAF